jgi:hypothetical protein
MKEPFSTVKRADLSETIAAIGWKPEAGDLFDKIAKDWYFHSRPDLVLNVLDGEKFDLMIVDFIIKYGPDFWPKEDRNHLLHNSVYRPGSWKKGLDISYMYPRDSIYRSAIAGVRNITQAVQREEQINSL